MFQVYKQQAGAGNPMGECLEPGWYWVKTRLGAADQLPYPYGLERGPFRTKREAERAARKAQVDE